MMMMKKMTKMMNLNYLKNLMSLKILRNKILKMKNYLNLSEKNLKNCYLAQPTLCLKTAPPEFLMFPNCFLHLALPELKQSRCYCCFGLVGYYLQESKQIRYYCHFGLVCCHYIPVV